MGRLGEQDLTPISGTPASRMPADDVQSRRARRAELLLQRQRAAQRRRQRGFGLRLPSSKPLVFPEPQAPAN